MKFLLLLALGVVAAHAEQSQVLKDFNIGYTQFSADVYKELLKTNSGNFLVSPLTVEIITALTAHGAKGNTAQQLVDGLHLPENKEKVKPIFQELTSHLQGNDKYTITSANKIYLQDGFKIVDDFKSSAVDVFKSYIQNIDFTNKEAAASEINKWVEEQTHNKIKNLIEEDDLELGTLAVLVNALYFHGDWVTKFNQELTKKRTFHTSNKNEVEVDMMELTNDFRYYECADMKAQFVELPYDGGDITMTIVLPNDNDGLADLEGHIDHILVEPNYGVERVHIVLPKFKSESTIQFKQILQAFGVVDAFEDFADFSGLSTQPTKISKIIQKTFIEVDEAGTTAAAATAVIHHFRISSSYKFEPKEFIADHPFIYYLKSRAAGIMFVGRYVQK